MSFARFSLLAAFLWLCFASAGARADESREFRHDYRIELPLLFGGAAAWFTSELLKPSIAPAACRVCGVNAVDREINQALRWSEYDRAAHISDALLFGVLPVGTLGGTLAMAYAHGRGREPLVDMLIISEALVLTSALTQITKYTVGRARPYVRTQRDEGRDFVASPDDHLSFFSGHTSITFTLAVAAGTTASLRGYRQAPILWAVALPLAAFTGYLRMAADRHYFSDVLTGALVGSAVGVLVPLLHTRERRSDASVMPAIGGAPPAALTFTWTR